MDGLESEPFADVAPYIFEDLGRAYAVVMDWLSLVMILLFVVSVIIAGRKSKDYKCRHCGKRFDRFQRRRRILGLTLTWKAMKGSFILPIWKE